jgi:unsaturated rhamnogalacturonyl hydrolase
LKSVRLGLLDDRYEPAIRKTISGILPLIDEAGKVDGVSGGTPVMPTITAYNRIAVHPTLYGQGITLMLLSEYMKE